MYEKISIPDYWASIGILQECENNPLFKERANNTYEWDEGKATLVFSPESRCSPSFLELSADSEEVFAIFKKKILSWMSETKR